MPVLVKPFLKWAGGKSRLVSCIKEVLPQGKRLIEPFAGSAALFLNTNYSQYIIADANDDLIHLYLYLQKEGKTFIEYAKKFFVPENNQKEKYLELREIFNTTRDIRLKSALFIYLNKHGFNGLCRYNVQHLFNVPFGLYIKPPVFPEKEMIFFYEKSQIATFLFSDFKKTLTYAKAEDVVYCDPPYVPLSKTANFTSFSSEQFNLSDQEDLALLAEQISRKGVRVIISNHYTEFTAKIYAKAKLHYFDVQRLISSVGNKREKVKELLAVFD